MAEKDSRLKRLWRDLQILLDEDVAGLVGWRQRMHRFVHFWAMVVRSFIRNRCPVRASALAYATLLALIPMLAVVAGVTSTFLKQEGEEKIDAFIEKFVASVTPPALLTTNLTAVRTNISVNLTNVVLTNTVTQVQRGVAGVEDPLPVAAGEAGGAGAETNVVQITTAATATNETVIPSFLRHEDVVDARKTVARRINDFIQNTRSGTLGITGSIVLLFVAISMLSRIEVTFNDIWGVSRGRSWFMRIVLYWGVITLAPLLVVIAIGLATGPHLERTREFLVFSPFLASLLFRFLPIAMLAVTFAAFYMLMPNTKVHWQAALAGGVVAGMLFHLNNSFSVLYVSRVVSNSKIYGGLGLVPVFMIGLYFSWLLLLFGAQVAYAWQNRESYLEQRRSDTVNQRGREFVALRLMTAIGQRFGEGQPPPTLSELSKQLCVPSRLARQVLQALGGARLVLEVWGTETAYAPARPLESITCHDVLQALRATNGHDLATRDEPAREEVFGEFARIQEAERRAATAVSLLALVNRTRPAALPENTTAGRTGK